MPGADCSLLFGILALQNNFIDRDALLAAFQSWIVDKRRSLGAILLDKGLLTEARVALLEALVGEHLLQHGDDPRRSLAALGPLGSARETLGAVADPDLRASLAYVSGALESDDPYPTRLGSIGPPTSTSGRFQILWFHDQGGLGQVSVALDLELGRQVALKEIQDRYADDPESRSRFVQEAEITGKLEHPGIVPVYGLGRDPAGRPYYAMRFIKGDSLLAAIKRFHGGDHPGLDPGRRAVALRDLIGRFLDVCNAVAYAHSRGVLHRDIKPGNVMLGPFGETLVVDWGLAKPMGTTDDPAEEPVRPSSGEGSDHVTRGVVGTPAYMCPEQAQGRHDLLCPASDVYSLGATLYHLLTGRAPFSDAEAPILSRVVGGEFPKPRQVRRDVERPLEAICLKAMALGPSDRYPSPRTLSDDVRRWLAGEPVLAWREPWTIRLGRWVARNRTAVAAVLAATFVTLVAASIAWAQAIARDAREAARAENLLGSLATAETVYVPQIIRDLAPHRWRIVPQIRSLYRGKGSSPQVRLHAALALLPDDPDLGEYLYERLLTADPSALLVIRDALRSGYAKQLGPRLWKILDDGKSDGDRRLRAACALAEYEPGDPRWPRIAGNLVDLLVKENRLFVSGWARALGPVKSALRIPLSEIVRRRDHDQGRSPSEVAQANDILFDYIPDDPETLAGLILDLEPGLFNRLIVRLEAGRERAIVPLKAILENQATSGDPVARDLEARRRARATIALARLGESAPLLRLLASSPDPASRAYLLGDLALLGVDRKLLVARLETESDPEALRALALGVGEFADWDEDGRRAIVARLSTLYREAPDPGLHSAVEWSLRRVSGDGPARTIDAELAARPRPPGRRWYVNQEQQTFVLLGPQDFSMGSPADEPDRTPIGDETNHRRRIDRRFAVATKEVTFDQFRRFCDDLNKPKAYGPDNGGPVLTAYGPDKDGPVLTVSWIDAALYCRWLSEKDGIAEDQMCYLPASDPKNGVIVAENCLGRSGYRLPTEAEWECACRSGTITGRPCGDTAVLLPRYAWFSPHSEGKAHAVGRLRPNDWGFFDMLGNANEWCHDAEGDYPTPVGDSIAVDSPRTDLATSFDRIQRGGCYGYNAPSLRSAQREWYDHRLRNVAFGFRVARTMPGGAADP
jgi:formylglycine-generating enzyme required for sulfatase activity